MKPRRDWPKHSDKTDISFINVFYPPGNAGNFIVTLIKTALKFQRVAGLEHLETDKNEFNKTILLPFINRWHMSDIGADIELKDWQLSRNIYIKSDYHDYMNFGARLFVYKRGEDETMEHYQEISDQHKDLDDYMTELMAVYPNSVFVLDFKKFFIEEDDKHINDFFDYILAWNYQLRDHVKTRIRPYMEKNYEVIDEYLNNNPDYVKQFLDNE